MKQLQSFLATLRMTLQPFLVTHMINAYPCE